MKHVIASSILVLSFVTALATAQTGGQNTLGQPANAQLLRTEAEVAQALRAAREELMIATPRLLSHDIADAVRAASVERGVSVYILAPAEEIEVPASYLPSLSLAGAALSVAPAYEPFIVIDRQSVLTGALISSEPTLPGGAAGATFLTLDPSYAAPFVESFYASFNAAQPYNVEAYIEQQTFLQEQEGP